MDKQCVLVKHQDVYPESLNNELMPINFLDEYS